VSIDISSPTIRPALATLHATKIFLYDVFVALILVPTVNALIIVTRHAGASVGSRTGASPIPGSILATTIVSSRSELLWHEADVGV